MSKVRQAPTIYDVAKRAGVSHQTVSRYLRGFKGIRPGTAQRVQDAIVALDYRTNYAARQLRLRHAQRVGVLAHDLDKAGPALILKGAFAEAKRRGYVLDIILIDGDDRDSIEEGVSRALEQRIAGILATSQSDVLVEELRGLVGSIPIGGEIETSDHSRLVNEIAGQLAADHLIELGHRRIGYVSGPQGWDASRRRQDGFLERLDEASLGPMWTVVGDWSAASGRNAVRSLGAALNDVTAIAAANDSMAIGIISALTAAGIAVPSEVSVVGIDDVAEAEFHIPSLSTVAMDHEGQGALSMSELLDQIEGIVSESAAILAAPLLRPRQSTAIARR